METASFEVDAIIEIPRGSRNKYEYDPETNSFRLDRVLFSSIHYPTDYGFIPGTKMPDGDPLDIMVVVEEPTFPGCREKARVIGVLHMEDEVGFDDKILAVSAVDARFCGINDLADLQPHWLHEIENFFEMYKTLEKKKSNVRGWGDLKEATALLEKCDFVPSSQPGATCQNEPGQHPKLGLAS